MREEANKNQLEGIQNDGKNLLDQSLIPDVYFTIELRTITFVQDSKQNLISHFLSIFLIRFKPMIKQFSHFSYGGIGKRKPNWLNGNSSKSNILWVTFLAASTSSIPPSGSHQDPTTSSLVAEPPNSILIVLTSQCVLFHVSFLSLSLILIVFVLMFVLLLQMFKKSKKHCPHQPGRPTKNSTSIR